MSDNAGGEDQMMMGEGRDLDAKLKSLDFIQQALRSHLKFVFFFLNGLLGYNSSPYSSPT